MMTPSFPRSNNSELSAQRIASPEKFRAKVLLALRLNEWHHANAAEALGVHRNTLRRWLEADPELAAEAEGERVLASGPTPTQ